MKHSLLVILLLLGTFVRLFHISDYLLFGFDQGRDAAVIWQLCHNSKLFLIGPTTGIEGIFLGPFYYYFIAPAYCLSQGNPVFPAALLGFSNVLAGLLLYYLVFKISGKTAALLSLAFFYLSYPLVVYHRWLSNPTPLALFSLLSLVSLYHLIRGQKTWWLILGFSLGISLQLEAASAIFFLPATLIILFIYKIRPSIWGLVAFLSTLSFQLIFDFRHEHLLFNAFYRFLITEKSFQSSLISQFIPKLSFYYQVVTSKFFSLPVLQVFLLSFISGIGILFRKSLPKYFSLLFVWLVVPFIGLMFYQGNSGHVWDYYFMGVFPVIMAISAIILILGWHKRLLLRPFVCILIAAFFISNFNNLKSYLFREPDFLSLTNSLAAVRYVYEDSSSTSFNVDVYVPSVIPHSYNYLFLWQGTNQYHRSPDSNQQSLLYLIYESDFERSSRLDAWLTRQSTIGKLLTSRNFGSITVQRRLRYD